MYQNPPRHPPLPIESPTALRRRRRIVPPLVFLTLFCLAFFGGSYAASPEPDVRMQPGLGVATVDGRPLVLVPYERNGVRGMFQLLVRDMFQTRLAAVDPASGEVRWDTQLSDELIWEASVLATGAKYAYLTTGDGLMVINLADGATVDLQGLSEPLTAPSAYGYDPAARRVVALNLSGEVLMIGLDRATAVRADAQTAAAWSSRLAGDGTPRDPVATSQEATIGGARIALRDLPVGPTGGALVMVEDGMEIPVGGLLFAGGKLVVDGEAAVGGPGLVLVEHQRSANDSGYALSLVSVTTGLPTSTVELTDQVERAVPAPDGVVAVAARSDLVLVRADELVKVPVGAAGFFGA